MHLPGVYVIEVADVFQFLACNGIPKVQALGQDVPIKNCLLPDEPAIRTKVSKRIMRKGQTS